VVTYLGPGNGPGWWARRRPSPALNSPPPRHPDPAPADVTAALRRRTTNLGGIRRSLPGTGYGNLNMWLTVRH
jgi:hypothetical protein